MPSGPPKARFDAGEQPSTPYSLKSSFRVAMPRDSRSERSEEIATSSLDNSQTPVTPVPGQIPFAAHEVRVPSEWASLVYTSPAHGPFVTGHTPQSIYYPVPLLPRPTPREMADASIQTEAVEAVDPRNEMAIDFASNIFNGIIPNTEVGGRQRNKFRWPLGLKIGPEDRLLVVFRAIKMAGFPTFGAFLAQAFDNDATYNKHPTVYHTLASFLQAKERSHTNHPVAILDLIFRHKKSQEFVDGIAVEPNFTRPRYALPPSIRAKPLGSISSPNTTYNAMVNWSLQRMIERFEKETKQLLQPHHGFMHRPKDPPLTWELLLGWSMSQSQEIVALNAPAIFTLFTTIAVNQNARKKLEALVAAEAEEREELSGSLNGILPFIDEMADDESARDSTPNPPPASSEPTEPGESEDDEDDPSPSPDSQDLPEHPLLSDKVGRRDPWQAVTVFILVLLSFRNQFALMLPILIGLFAFTCNANRELISILCRLGLSVSYRMILAQLHLLGADSAQQLRLIGAFNELTGPQFLVLFDNVNKMKRAWRAALGHKDEVKSGTASTIIGLVDVRPNALLSEPVIKAKEEGRRGALTVKQLRDDIDQKHIRGVGIGQVLRVWLKYIPALSGHRAAVEDIFKSEFSKHRLKLRKSDIRSTRVTSIDESTTVGAASVLHNLIIGQLSIVPSSLYRWLVIICGDQLSIDRIRKLKEYTRKFFTPFTRHEWALPVIQLWHLKWNWQKAIFRLHWHPDLGKDIFGLHHDCELLDRGKFNPKKCDFYPGHHILEDRFDAVVLQALHLICQQQTGVIYGTDIKLTDAVSKYFEPDGRFDECTFEDLRKLAGIVYDRYMCIAAGEDALGHSSRDTEIYGPAWTAETNVESDEDEMDSMPSLAPLGSAAKPPPAKKQKRSRAKASGQPQRNFSSGDQVMVNLCHFMRVTFWYLELCSAIAEGDIGRVFEVIKLLRFSFWGAGSTNYGNELLELACNFLYEWSDDLRMTVLENYLVNPTGRIGYWLELDLLQEHFNFWIKALFNSKSHDFDGKHLSEAVGLNITGISKIRELFPGLFGLKKNGQKHRKVVAVDDINRLGAHFRDQHILEWESGRCQPYLAPNEFAEGVSVLSSGTLETFLKRTMSGKPVHTEELDLEDVEEPPCPATMIEGVMDVNEFITGTPAM
ncbi:hypothetical protein R3P38DRAFT_2954526 [Favolaschia claudopus]|uniref:DUF6589 domain-containing protein n=1 Tax=Favolaschia claudopus TaxID=2862362 RepID=A0AAW0BCD3_9AGAR